MKQLNLKSVKMTEEVMQMLEDRNLIIRLAPGHHRKKIEKFQGEGIEIYRSDEKYGGHKLITCIIDRIEFSAFATHKDNEEFMLISEDNEKTLYLLIAFDLRERFVEKLEKGLLTEDDFICLECVPNDPRLSFFTMLKNVPHGEATKEEDKLPATFYVTEPANLESDLLDLSDYNITIDG